MRVKNWDRFQHYKNREHPPPWIKLYESLLTDYEFQSLSESNRYKLIGIWLLASKQGNELPNDAAYVARCIGVKRLDLDLFISRGWLEHVYTDSRDGLDQSREEKKRGEEKEKNLRAVTSEVDAQPPNLTNIIDMSLKEGAA